MEEEAIMKRISEICKASGNHSGASIIDLVKGSNEDLRYIKKTLNRLYSEGKINVTNGLNHKLVFLKQTK